MSASLKQIEEQARTLSAEERAKLAESMLESLHGSLAEIEAAWRLAGIERDLPRGAPPTTVDVARLVELTTQSTPRAATHWSTRTMAAELDISPASVSRHWRKNGLKPRVVHRFKASRDPKFVEKLEDIVGLYLSPAQTCADVVLR